MLGFLEELDRAAIQVPEDLLARLAAAAPEAGVGSIMQPCHAQGVGAAPRPAPRRTPRPPADR